MSMTFEEWWAGWDCATDPEMENTKSFARFAWKAAQREATAATIERCAKVCGEACDDHIEADVCARAIRALSEQ